MFCHKYILDQMLALKVKAKRIRRKASWLFQYKKKQTHLVVGLSKNNIASCAKTIFTALTHCNQHAAWLFQILFPQIGKAGNSTAVYYTVITRPADLHD